MWRHLKRHQTLGVLKFPPVELRQEEKGAGHILKNDRAVRLDRIG